MKLLKFSASWCQPCKALSTMLANTTLPFEIEEIDVDENHDLPAKFMVRGVPTLIAVDDDGVEVDRLVGSISSQALSKWVINLPGSTVAQ